MYLGRLGCYSDVDGGSNVQLLGVQIVCGSRDMRYVEVQISIESCLVVTASPGVRYEVLLMRKNQLQAVEALSM